MHVRGAEDDDETPRIPATRWERFGNTLQPTTTSITGTDPEVDRVLAQKFGSKQYSPDRVREAEERLHKRLSGHRDDQDKVPVHERPEPHATPVCPVDAVRLEVTSYSDSGQPATRQCPVCKRTEGQFLEKGVDLTPITERIGASMEAGGLRKKPRFCPIEQHVRTLIRPW